MKIKRIFAFFSLLLAIASLISFIAPAAQARSATESTPLVELDMIRDTNENSNHTGVKVGNWTDTDGTKYKNSLRFGVVYKKDSDGKNYNRTEYIDYQLGKRYSTLSGIIACGKGSEKDAIMTVAVWVDGEKVFEEEDITYSDVIPFYVDVEDGKVLRVVCSTATDDFGYCIVSAEMDRENASEYMSSKQENDTEVEAVPLTDLDVIRDTSANDNSTDVKVGNWYDTNGTKYKNALRFSVVYKKDSDGKTYSRTEYIDYQLGKRYSTLSGIIACGKGSEKDAIMTVAVWVDGEKVFEEEDITYYDVIPFTVDVEDGKVLRVVCSTATDDFGYCIVSAEMDCENTSEYISSENTDETNTDTTSLVELDVIKDTSANNNSTDVKVGNWYDTNGTKYKNALRFSVVYKKDSDGKTYSRTEYIDYQLGKRYSTLSGVIACGKGSEKDAIMTVAVWVDGEKVFEEEDITYYDVIPFTVDVEDGKVLRVVCSTATDDYGYCIVTGELL